jgi:hypothetical protein
MYEVNTSWRDCPCVPCPILISTKEVKSCPATVMQARRERGVELLLILELGTRWNETPASPPAAFFPLERIAGTH